MSSLMQEGSEILFTIRTANVAQRETTSNATAINVSYDAFVDDIQARTLPLQKDVQEDPF